MADVNWKSIRDISIIGGLIGYIGAWYKERRYVNYLVNKFGVFDAESFSAEEDYCDDCGSTDNVCAVTDLCDDCMDSAGYDWDGRNRPNECPHCGEMDSMFIYEGGWECEECDKLAYDAETFEARGGKRMYCPKCQKNRTWNRGFKKHQMEKGDNPSDFIFYVCQKCNYAYDPKTRLEIKDWRTKFGYDAESKKTNEMDKFFEWILKEKPTSRQTTKPYSRKVDYLAQRYSDGELKTGLVNAFNAGDIDNAKLFAAALGRQGFISKYQAERKV